MKYLAQGLPLIKHVIKVIIIVDVVHAAVLVFSRYTLGFSRDLVARERVAKVIFFLLLF